MLISSRTCRRCGVEAQAPNWQMGAPETEGMARGAAITWGCCCVGMGDGRAAPGTPNHRSAQRMVLGACNARSALELSGTDHDAQLPPLYAGVQHVDHGDSSALCPAVPRHQTTPWGTAAAAHNPRRSTAELSWPPHRPAAERDFRMAGKPTITPGDCGCSLVGIPAAWRRTSHSSPKGRRFQSWAPQPGELGGYGNRRWRVSGRGRIGRSESLRVSQGTRWTASHSRIGRVVNPGEVAEDGAIARADTGAHDQPLARSAASACCCSSMNMSGAATIARKPSRASRARSSLCTGKLLELDSSWWQE